MSVNEGVRGSFLSAVQDLVPILAVQPHQIIAASDPRSPAKALVAKARRAKRLPARKINDQLSARPER